MSEVKFLVDQIRRTFDGDCWHGPSLMKTLEGVGLEQAKAKPLNGRHSIWELVDHMSFWMDEAAWTVKNNRIFDIDQTMNWSMMGETQEDWSASIKRLESSMDHLVSSLDDICNEDLDRQIQGAIFSYRQMLHGVVHHNIYHSGQIAILKPKK